MASLSEKENFISEIAPLIQKEAKKRGYKVCSPILAQACCESNFGQSVLSKRYANYFGLKCGAYWKGASVNLKTKEEYSGKLTTIRDNFRVYLKDGLPSMEEGVKGYFDFISTKRYANLKDATTPNEYLELIKKDGYCTSSTYVRTCMDHVAKYNLTRFDDKQYEDNPYELTCYLLKRGSRGESVKWLQYELRKAGEEISIDGIYGCKTIAAVIDFQQMHTYNGKKLKVDGIAGTNTINCLKGM